MTKDVSDDSDPLSLVERVAASARASFLKKPSGHRWQPINRLLRLRRPMAIQEGANPEAAEQGVLVLDGVATNSFKRAGVNTSMQIPNYRVKLHVRFH